MAGGANVLCGPDPFRIGERNAQVTLDYLSKRSISLRHADVGGCLNRALHLEIGTGYVTVKTPTDEAQYSLEG